jgi:hypothetical protein
VEEFQKNVIAQSVERQTAVLGDARSNPIECNLFFYPRARRALRVYFHFVVVVLLVVLVLVLVRIDVSQIKAF